MRRRHAIVIISPRLQFVFRPFRKTGFSNLSSRPTRLFTITTSRIFSRQAPRAHSSHSTSPESILVTHFCKCKYLKNCKYLNNCSVFLRQTEREKCNDITPMAEGHWKICRPRAKHYVARGPHDAARGPSAKGVILLHYVHVH